MLGTDHQFSLNHLPNGNKNALGSLFLDFRSHEDSVHLIIYGHNDYREEIGRLEEFP